ncbi:hypothetical protein OAS86_03860 [Gammaproteobacteria bacterium]|nr:hypothetical protein [Gammaproteobacteria bacterium]
MSAPDPVQSSIYRRPLSMLILLLSLSTAAEDKAPLDNILAPPASANDDDVCVYDIEPDPDFADRLRRFSRTVSCDTLEMVDGWFGDDRPFDPEPVRGRLSQSFAYDDYNGFKARTRFRLRGELPNALNRWNIIIGRDDVEDFNDDFDQNSTNLRNQISNSRSEDDWLVGIGSRKQNEGRWSYSASVRLSGSKLDPYVRARYRRATKLNERTDFTFRQTFFWQESRDFGTTTNADFVYEFDPKLLLRGEFNGTIAGDTQGADWWTGATVYQWLSPRNSMRYELYINGETEDDVKIHEYGSTIVFRRELRTNWLYVEGGPEVFWPRRDEEEVRDVTYGLTVKFDLYFGKR